MKIISWNVNGYRSILKKGLEDFVKLENPDILCLQEIKTPNTISDENNKAWLSTLSPLLDYQIIWYPAIKNGYSGTAIFSKNKPIQHQLGMKDETHNTEGRIITAEYPDFYLVNTYVPNSQRGLTRLDYRMYWDIDLRIHLAHLQIKKPVILCGDLNVAHQEIDLTYPNANKNNPGFTQKERDNFTRLLDIGLIDSFRYFNQQPYRYTWWSYMNNARKNNIGWRIDYFCVSDTYISHIENSKILADIMGSDHCPISIDIK